MTLLPRVEHAATLFDVEVTEKADGETEVKVTDAAAGPAEAATAAIAVYKYCAHGNPSIRFGHLLISNPHDDDGYAWSLTLTQAVDGDDDDDDDDE